MFNKGDGINFTIAAASIIAKTERDRMMEALDLEYPGYGFAAHKGYGTPEHRAALKRLGPSTVHRMSFPVMHELQGEYSPLFYLLKAQLEAARSRAALDEVEAALRAQAAELAEQECRKLRLLMLRRWKFVGQAQTSVLRRSARAIRVPSHTYCAPDATTVTKMIAKSAGIQARTSIQPAAVAMTTSSTPNSMNVFALESRVGLISSGPRDQAIGEHARRR